MIYLSSLASIFKTHNVTLCFHFQRNGKKFRKNFFIGTENGQSRSLILF